MSLYQLAEDDRNQDRTARIARLIARRLKAAFIELDQEQSERFWPFAQYPLLAIDYGGVRVVPKIDDIDIDVPEPDKTTIRLAVSVAGGGIVRKDCTSIPHVVNSVRKAARSFEPPAAP